MNEKQIEVLEKAIEKYGKKAQVLQAIEEMSELTKELIKNINRGQDNIKDIILEIADVQITIYEIIMMYSKEDSDFGDKLLGAIEYKIQRLKQRMEV